MIFRILLTAAIMASAPILQAQEDLTGTGVPDTGAGPSTVGGGTALPGGTDTPPPYPTPDASAGSGGADSAASPITTVAGGGFAAQRLTPGEGRFAQPPIRFLFTLQQGYDDNVFNTPTELPPVPEQPEQIIIFNPDTGQFEIVELEPPPKPIERTGSFVTQGNLTVQVQVDNPRGALSLDGVLSSLYYWDRPGDQLDVNGSLGATFGYRLTPRVQVAGQIDAVYQSEPDVTRVNAPTDQGVGNYLLGNSRFDLSYSMTPRFQAIGSIGLNTLQYEDELRSGGNYYDVTFGAQGRYLWRPRVTLLGEYRFSTITYETPEFDSRTHFFLGGAEVKVMPRLTITGKGGLSLRTFETGGNSSSPYGEGALRYQFRENSSLTWDIRYGFEESPSATVRRTALRTGITLTHTWSSKFNTSTGIYYSGVRNEDESEGAGDPIAEHAFDARLGASFLLTRTLALNFAYTYTQVISDLDFADYYRNRVFIGATMAF
jgi:hypothetical protein